MSVIYKRIISITLILCLSFMTVAIANPSTQVDTDVSTQLVKAESGILMEASTGDILYEWNPDQKLHIASVTKTMALLIIMEALDSGKIKLTDMVTTSENATSMGGTQVFLEIGEQMSVDDMIKAITVSSANDAAVAMAEHIGGTHEAFVEMMNERASALGCNNTHFINCTGLDETADHYSSARDIAIISRELLKHEKIFDYTTIWMDTLRDGTFGLSNTNRLIRFYNGANGLKTGSTSTAKYCLSATAKRDNMQLIAVVLGAPTTGERFSSASALLDYGFANYSVVTESQLNIDFPAIPVHGGTESFVDTTGKDISFIVKKGNGSKVETEILSEPFVKAPIDANQKLGEIVFKIDGTEVTRRDLVAKTDVPQIGIFKTFLKLINLWMTA